MKRSLVALGILALGLGACSPEPEPRAPDSCLEALRMADLLLGDYEHQASVFSDLVHGDAYMLSDNEYYASLEETLATGGQIGLARPLYERTVTECFDTLPSGL